MLDGSSVACHHPITRTNRTCGFSLNTRSEEHTSELQSRLHLVCRLLLEKKKIEPIAHGVQVPADPEAQGHAHVLSIPERRPAPVRPPLYRLTLVQPVAESDDLPGSRHRP